MPNDLRERWAADLSRCAAHGNVDVPGMIGDWLADPSWMVCARSIMPAVRRRVLADLGRETWEQDAGNFATELRWNTRRLEHVWTVDQREGMLSRHVELLFGSAADAVTLGGGPTDERTELVGETKIVGSEHLREALGAGRGVVLVGAYQGDPRFLLLHPLLARCSVGALRAATDGRASQLLSGVGANVTELPADVRGVRTLLTLLTEGGCIAFYNDWLPPGRAATLVPLFGRLVTASRAIVAIILHSRAAVLPIAVARDAVQAPAAIEFFPALELGNFDRRDPAACNAAAWMLGVATECLIRRHPADWRLWNSLEHRWAAADEAACAS
jgi:lauroyl/myristoyl acyltransferase